MYAHCLLLLPNGYTHPNFNLNVKGKCYDKLFFSDKVLICIICQTAVDTKLIKLGSKGVQSLILQSNKKGSPFYLYFNCIGSMSVYLMQLLLLKIYRNTCFVSILL